MKKYGFWFAAILLLVVLQSTLRGLIGAYNYQIVILVGINIILAVSLNLINGVTGQFSIGHAGFYAIGGYTSPALLFFWGVTYSGGPCFFSSKAPEAIFLVVCLLASAVSATLAGLAVSTS